MATKAVNARSQTIAARVPHDVISAMEATKEPGESTGQFVTAAIKRESEHRLSKAKPETPEE